MKQSELAAIIGSGASFVGNVENSNSPAKYNLKHINLIAAYFDIPPQAFLPDNSM